MSEARFKVGDLVRVQAAAAENAAEALIEAVNLIGHKTADEVFEVVALLPAANGQYQYRIRGSGTPPERIVRESQLAPASTAPPKG
jgi:hypothetical protein